MHFELLNTERDEFETKPYASISTKASLQP